MVNSMTKHSHVQENDFLPTLNIGMLGYGFMGKMHSHAYTVAQNIFTDIKVKPILYLVAGRTEDKLAEFAKRFGYLNYTTSWEEVIADPTIDAINVCLPEYLHKDVCISGLKAGKHILCEKPLALSVKECREILGTKASGDPIQMTGFVYRFLPAMQLAQHLIQTGVLGKIYYARLNYSQELGHDPNRPAEQVRYAWGPKQLGSIRGLGSHLIDAARFLLGDINWVSSTMRTFTQERKKANSELHQVLADELTIVNLEFTNGALGQFVVSAVATGRKNQFSFEINGSLGSITFDLEQLNYLNVYQEQVNLPELRGFTRINVTEPGHPLMKGWWPPAHNLGWEHGHINQIHHFLRCISGEDTVEPYGATFEDGLWAALIAQKVFQSSQAEGERQQIQISISSDDSS